MVPSLTQPQAYRKDSSEQPRQAFGAEVKKKTMAKIVEKLQAADKEMHPQRGKTR